jgi:predicted aconitase
MTVALTPEEERMISGKYGPGVQKSMGFLVQLGEAFDAKKMVEISSSHLIPFEIMSASKPGRAPGKWIDDLFGQFTEGIDSFRVPTTVNPAIVNPLQSIELGFDKLDVDPTENVVNRMEVYKKLGVIPAYTCCPFMVYTPRKGEHLGGAESVAVVFNNSFFGSLVNRESGPSALAAAVTGRVPDFGMHILENRSGQFLVEIGEDLDPTKFTYADYNALAYYVGEEARELIPIYSGLPKNMSIAQIKYVCAPLGVSAGLPMCHIVGVTPEAPTVEAALMGGKPEMKMRFGKSDLAKAYSRLTTANTDGVDAVTLGCPHATLQEIKECALMLSGRKISANVIFWLATVETVRILAERMGFVKAIEEAGGHVVTNMCSHAYIYCRGAYARKYGIRNVATNSAKAAHYINSISVAKTWFGSMKKCVDAAVSGRWEQ